MNIAVQVCRVQLVGTISLLHLHGLCKSIILFDLHLMLVKFVKGP